MKARKKSAEAPTEEAGVAGNFLIRTMMTRDPSKRRVKPVENFELLELAGGEDSSDDSDYEIGKHTGSHSEDGGDDDASSDGGEDDEDMDEDDEQDSDHNTDTEDVPVVKEEPAEPEPASDVDTTPKPRKESPPKKMSTQALTEKAMRLKEISERQRTAPIENAPPVKIAICAVCLGETSVETDEIVQCDFCFVTVHESCYGITDCDTVVSTQSSSDTEPWFCDSCKAGQMQPTCELCPNTGGIFKETDVGRWVHLTCALYVPGAAFGNVEKLSPVTLFEMPYSRWGERECVLCEDIKFARTGVCIRCDAGLCKTYFHVSCAQSHGLLCETTNREEISEPFYADCSLHHADKKRIEDKRQKWFALRALQRQKRPSEDPKEHSRILRKLEWFRGKYRAGNLTREMPWVPTQKIARELTSSVSACRKLFRKAALYGVSTPGVEGPLLRVKAPFVPPAFSIDYVAYYMDREQKIQHLKQELQKQMVEGAQLRQEEMRLRQRYESQMAISEADKAKTKNYRDATLSLLNIMSAVGGEEIPIPDILTEEANGDDGSGDSKPLSQCKECEQTTEQHQITQCDSCHAHYHLYCCDPPLTRMPKRTKGVGWSCSECEEENDRRVEEGKGGSVGGEKESDPDAPRQLRATAKHKRARYDDAVVVEQQLAANAKKRRRQQQQRRSKK